MNLERLYQILQETTMQLRKGGEVEEQKVGNINISKVFAIPHESEYKGNGIVKIDCHYIIVAVDKVKTEKYREELITILKEYPTPDRLTEGPSYIEVGAQIGDQGATLQLFALGEVLGFWSIITPKTLGVTDSEVADQMAGSGMIMISGFKTT